MDNQPKKINKQKNKKSSWELKIGLHLLNKVGILLILLGVIAGFKYSYTHWISHWINDYVKGIAFFLLGGVFTAGGEWFYREQKQVFALGLLGGGISILYASVFCSYFVLNIINLMIAFAFMILLTFAAVASALRYDSRTICSLGLLGGYLTFITYVINEQLIHTSLYLTMIYLLILTISVLIISFNKRWIILNYISFFAHLPALIFLVTKVEPPLIGILYTLVTFIIYLTIVLAYPCKHKVSLQWLDIGLLAINTIVSSILFYNLLLAANLEVLTGLVALIFSLVYLGLARFMKQRIPSEKSTFLLFSGAAFTCAVLMIPLQFGVEWLTVGWLIEGLVLVLYGHKNNLKKLTTSGWWLLGCCLLLFVFSDLPQAVIGIGDNFGIKYFVVIVVQIILLVLYLLDINAGKISKDSKLACWITRFKYVTVIHAWIYLIYYSINLSTDLIAYENIHFYNVLLLGLISIAYGQLISRLEIICDKVIKNFSVFLYILGDLLCLEITLTEAIFLQSPASSLKWLSLIILIVYNVLVFFNIKDLLTVLFNNKKFSFKWLPVVLSVYLLGVTTTFLVIQFDLGQYNLLFSFLYLILAISFIAYGYQKKFMYQRRLGLVLSLFATAKLFLYDLAFLGSGLKIIAYFVFGGVLLGISFIYQKIENAMDDCHVEG